MNNIVPRKHESHSNRDEYSRHLSHQAGSSSITIMLASVIRLEDHRSPVENRLSRRIGEISQVEEGRQGRIRLPLAREIVPPRCSQKKKKKKKGRRSFPSARSNRSKMTTSRHHLAARETRDVLVAKGYTREWETKRKKKSAYSASETRLSLIHSDPFYLENSSRKGRPISRKVEEGGEREEERGRRGKGEGRELVEKKHSGRYLGRTVNVLIATRRRQRSDASMGLLHSPSLPMLSPSGFRGPEHRSWSP